MGIITYNGLTGIFAVKTVVCRSFLAPLGVPVKVTLAGAGTGTCPGIYKCIYKGFTIDGSNIMSWGQHRRGRHVSIAVPPEIKCQLIRNKALGGGGIGAQIVEALQYKWGTVPMAPPAVIQNPAGLDRVESGRFKGMRSQPIDKTTIPWQI